METNVSAVYLPEFTIREKSFCACSEALVWALAQVTEARHTALSMIGICESMWVQLIKITLGSCPGRIHFLYLSVAVITCISPFHPPPPFHSCIKTFRQTKANSRAFVLMLKCAPKVSHSEIRPTECNSAYFRVQRAYALHVNLRHFPFLAGSYSQLGEPHPP